MDKPKTQSQKRNQRRTINKKKRAKDESLYNIGDAVIAELRDITDMGEPISFNCKGFIVKKIYNQDKEFMYYIIRTELPIEIESCFNTPFGRDFEEARENCSFSRKRYSKEQFEALIHHLSGSVHGNIDRLAYDFHDYLTVHQDDIKSHFPLSTTKLTAEECLYNYWIKNKFIAIGKLSITTDKQILENWCFENRDNWTYYANRELPDRLIRVGLYLSSNKDIHKRKSTVVYCPDFLQRSDGSFPFYNGFETMRGHPYMTSSSKPKNGDPVMCTLKYDSNNQIRIKRWRIISEEMYNLFIYILTLRTSVQLDKKGLPYGEYLDKPYNELPQDIKDRFSSLMWPRDSIYKVEKEDDFYSYNRTKLVEINTV